MKNVAASNSSEVLWPHCESMAASCPSFISSFVGLPKVTNSRATEMNADLQFQDDCMRLIIMISLSPNMLAGRI
jgi:hypothetical protein